MNISLRLHIRGLAIALVLCAALLAPRFAAAQTADTWTVREASDAATRHDAASQWVPLKPGDTIAEGASVRTGANGRLVVARSTHKDTITASPGSEFTLPQLTNEATEPTVLETLGTLLFKVEHTPGRHFEVKSPYLTAVVKGTVFTITITAAENVVHLASGSVEVTDANTKEVALLSPGQTARVAVAPGRPLKVTGLLPPGGAESDDKGEAQNSDTEQRITRTLGDVHLDVAGLTNNLVRPAATPGATANASKGSAAATSDNGAASVGTGSGSGNAASGAARVASSPVTSTVNPVGSGVAGTIGAVTNTAGTNAGSTASTVGSTVSGAVNTAGNTVSGAVNTGGNTVGNTVSGAGSTVGNVTSVTSGTSVASGPLGGVVNPVTPSSNGNTTSVVTNTSSSLLGTPKGTLK